MNGSNKTPLRGRCVAVTRAEHQADRLADLLRQLGADPLLVPVLRMVPPEDPAPLARSVGELDGYDWLLFTSPNGVRAFWQTWQTVNRRSAPEGWPGHLRVAAIGPGTAQALAEHGVSDVLVAQEFVGEGLAREVLLATRSTGPQRFLLPLARVARDTLPRALRAAGHVVDVVVAYETRPTDPSALQPLREGLQHQRVDAVVVSSSSTVEHLVAGLGADALPLLAATRVVSIGPITTQTATRLGVQVARTAHAYSLDGLVKAVVACLDPSTPFV